MLHYLQKTVISGRKHGPKDAFRLNVSKMLLSFLKVLELLLCEPCPMSVRCNSGVEQSWLKQMFMSVTFSVLFQVL